jgi:hypothetical protein
MTRNLYSDSYFSRGPSLSSGLPRMKCLSVSAPSNSTAVKCRPLASSVINRANVWVIQRRGIEGLALEPFAGGRIIFQLLRQKLQGDVGGSA